MSERSGVGAADSGADEPRDANPEWAAVDHRGHSVAAGALLGTSTEFWLNLQGIYEIRLAKKSGKMIHALPTIRDLRAG